MPDKGQSHHFRTITAIPEILGNEAKDDADYLQNCRTIRNAAEYDSANEASEGSAKELVIFAKDFDKRVRAWIKNKKF